jgi:hypothetical protein
MTALQSLRSSPPCESYTTIKERHAIEFGEILIKIEKTYREKYSMSPF